MKSVFWEKFLRTEIDNLTDAQHPTFELIHTDLASPIELADINGHRYAITFTDDFSGAIFAYFFKNKERHSICHKEIYH